MAAARVPVFPLFKTTLHLTARRIGPIALAAVLPFIASHGVVMAARRVGMPERLVLDLLHGFIVLAYLTATVRLAQSRGSGWARFGFARPRRVRWPGLGRVAAMAAVVLVIGLPVALLLHRLVQTLETVQANAGLYLPVTMLPEFVMTTLVGLVIAAGTAKISGQPDV